MAVVKKATNQQASSTRDVRQRVLTCLNKLSDRDTHSAAATELETIARSLTQEAIPPFLSSISATDSADKSPVRRQCLRLISLLSEHHGNLLSPYLSKLHSAIVRRLRDPDSSVRSACVAASASISSHVTRPPFSSIVKPFVDALAVEQDLNSQIGAALCVSSAIDSASDPEPLYLKRLLPRLEKLLKCDSFKAKAALLTLIGSVICAGGVSSPQAVRNLVSCLVDSLGSDDWAARKAASEALFKLAEVEGDALSELKAPCLKTFEAKKYDKVKSVRETMTQMLDSWKKIPDMSDDVSLPSESQSSPREGASDGRYRLASKISASLGCGTPQTRKNDMLSSTSPLPDGSSASTVRRRISFDGNNKKATSAIFRKLDRNKPDQNIKTGSRRYPSRPVLREDDHPSKGKDQVVGNAEKQKNRFVKPEMSRELLDKNPDERSEFTVVVSNASQNVRDEKESEDLSLIRKQLVQIENQQSHLLDLLQKFIGSSQNGMQSLETRVHGLELALDEISFDLAVSSGRISNKSSMGSSCCKLPGADFFSSKFWRKTGSRYGTSHFGMHSMASLRISASKNNNNKALEKPTRRFRNQGGSGFIVNPLAEIHNDPKGISGITTSGVSNSIHNAV